MCKTTPSPLQSHSSLPNRFPAQRYPIHSAKGCGERKKISCNQGSNPGPVLYQGAINLDNDHSPPLTLCTELDTFAIDTTMPQNTCSHNFSAHPPLQCAVISCDTSSNRGSSSWMPRKRNTDSLVARCLNTSYTTSGLLYGQRRSRHDHSLCMRYNKYTALVM